MTVRVYGFWRSIASFRVRVGLNLKKLAFEEVSVDILHGSQFRPDYDAVNAAHAVPALEDGEGHVLVQSLAILEYLDETFPDPPLLPRDPRLRAHARALALNTVADVHPLMVPRIRAYLAQNFGADDAAVQAWARHWIEQGLATYETLLSRRPAAPFALGAAPGIADICMAGHAVSAQLFKVDLAPYPAFAALTERCFARDEFASARMLTAP